MKATSLNRSSFSTYAYTRKARYITNCPSFDLAKSFHLWPKLLAYCLIDLNMTVVALTATSFLSAAAFSRFSSFCSAFKSSSSLFPIGMILFVPFRLASVSVSDSSIDISK